VRRRLVGGLLAGLLTAAFAFGAGDASAARPLPEHDAFYSYTGATPLADIKPGTVLKHRAVNVAINGSSTPIKADQLLYRTRGERGAPTVTVTTVLRPATGVVLPRIVDYLSFYDALGSMCDPSYTLPGGDPGAANRSLANEEEALIAAYLAADSIITIPDFEGENLEWTAGHEAGYGALDAVRATESFLKLPRLTKVGLTGYSGGSIAAEWGSELAPTYAKDLRIVGVAEGGIPVHFAHNLNYINGSVGWSGILPAAVVGLTRAYKIDLSPYLSAYGEKLTGDVQHACIGSFNGAYPYLRIQKLLNAQHQDPYQIADFVRVINALIMGSVPGHPKGPLFLAVGNADGTGDGVMVAKDVEGLAHEYCQQGVPLQFTVYNGSDHTQAAEHFEPAAVQFLTERFAGVPFTGNCSSVGAGNSLAPVPMPHATTAPDSGAINPTGSDSHARASGGLATTGLETLLPLVALLIVCAGATTAAVRRRAS
jgi:hypothetical protein